MTTTTTAAATTMILTIILHYVQCKSMRAIPQVHNADIQIQWEWDDSVSESSVGGGQGLLCCTSYFPAWDMRRCSSKPLDCNRDGGRANFRSALRASLCPHSQRPVHRVWFFLTRWWFCALSLCWVHLCHVCLNFLPRRTWWSPHPFPRLTSTPPARVCLPFHPVASHPTFLVCQTDMIEINPTLQIWWLVIHSPWP